MTGKSLLQTIGLTARDLVIIVLILADVYLVSTGHQAIDSKITQIEAQTAQACPVVLK